MSPQSRPRAPVAVLAIGTILIIAVVVSGIISGDGAGDLVYYSTAMAYFLGLGTLILWRVPGNRIGWVFTWMSLAIGLSGLAGLISDRGYLLGSAAAAALWVSFIGTFPLLFLWYPTGTVPAPPWRWVERVALFFIGSAILAALFADRICLEGDAGICERSADNPIGIPGVVNPEYSGPMGALLIVILIASLVSVAFRYRIADRQERLQVKWFLYATLAFILSIVAEIAYEAATQAAAPAWVSVLNGLALAAIPIAATLAILRYRLYEIDQLISRTVSYALVVGILGVVYFAVVSVLTTFLPSDDPVAIAVSTLAVAALFNPARRRVRRLVDRRFNRSRYDAARVVESFTSSLNERIDQNGLIDGWLGVVSETMHPVSASVWVRSA